MLTKLAIIKNKKKVIRKRKERKPKATPIKKKPKIDNEPKSKTELWTWVVCLVRKKFLNKPSIDFLLQTSEVNKCEICKKEIINEDSIVTKL